MFRAWYLPPSSVKDHVQNNVHYHQLDCWTCCSYAFQNNKYHRNSCVCFPWLSYELAGVAGLTMGTLGKIWSCTLAYTWNLQIPVQMYKNVCKEKCYILTLTGSSNITQSIQTTWHHNSSPCSVSKPNQKSVLLINWNVTYSGRLSLYECWPRIQKYLYERHYRWTACMNVYTHMSDLNYICKVAIFSLLECMRSKYITITCWLVHSLTYRATSSEAALHVEDHVCCKVHFHKCRLFFQET